MFTAQVIGNAAFARTLGASGDGANATTPGTAGAVATRTREGGAFPRVPLRLVRHEATLGAQLQPVVERGESASEFVELELGGASVPVAADDAATALDAIEARAHDLAQAERTVGASIARPRTPPGPDHGAVGGTPEFSTLKSHDQRLRFLIGDFISALLSFLVIPAVVASSSSGRSAR